MKRPTIRICPSVLAADFAHLADEVQRAEAAGADGLHIDIMDGHFVPNLSMGPAIVAAINRSTNLPLHVHLMMYNPYGYIDRFVEAGADAISFHFEATEEIEDTIAFIRTCSVRAGIAIRPETDGSFLQRYIPLIDDIIVMTVNPGFGGQAFMPEMIEKIKELRHFADIMKREPGLDPLNIIVDGGITNETALLCVQAGANSIVSGTHLFANPNMGKAITEMRESLTKATKAL